MQSKLNVIRIVRGGFKFSESNYGSSRRGKVTREKSNAIAMPPSGYLLKYFSHHIRITREIFEIYYDRIYHIPSLLIMIPQGGPNDLRLGGIHLLRIV